ncbi:hypothetical protein Pint_24245 [Pistacia integerrima]|uniref:Uncharacterized protein n=1 Tax=Pistacia integerrima TaxID=434235 RepID=A0ACC0YFH8_9ROSI|nr:hypothetical protein Pint_24245 [Pistacia integerrima]
MKLHHNQPFFKGSHNTSSAQNTFSEPHFIFKYTEATPCCGFILARHQQPWKPRDGLAQIALVTMPLHVLQTLPKDT